MSSNYTIDVPFLKKRIEGACDTEAEFKSKLKNVANGNPANVIKCYFMDKNKDIPLPHAKNGDTLYLLAVGEYKNALYSCFATSGDKYLQENYHIEKHELTTVDVLRKKKKLNM